MKQFSSAIFCLFIVFVTLLVEPADAQEITSANTFRYLGNGRYNWTVFIVTDEHTWNEIECVEYILHPTFPNPVHNLCGAAAKGSSDMAFPLTANGWGEFRIHIRAQFRNGTVRNIDHWLKLQ